MVTFIFLICIIIFLFITVKISSFSIWFLAICIFISGYFIRNFVVSSGNKSSSNTNHQENATISSNKQATKQNNSGNHRNNNRQKQKSNSTVAKVEYFIENPSLIEENSPTITDISSPIVELQPRDQQIESFEGSTFIEDTEQNILTRLEISPQAVELLPETEQKFTVTGYDQNNHQVELNKVTWKCSRGGKITNQGLFKGGYKRRQVTITAKAKNIKTSALVKLLPVVRSLQITPDYLILKPGQSQKFICTAIDQYGEVIDIDHSNIVWETTGGEITSNGILTVDDKAQEICSVTAKYISYQNNHNINSLNLGISLKIISYITSLNIFQNSVEEVIGDPEQTTDLLEATSEMLFGNGFNFDTQTWLIQQLIQLVSHTLDIVGEIFINQSVIAKSVNITIIQEIKNDDFSDPTCLSSINTSQPILEHQQRNQKIELNNFVCKYNSRGKITNQSLFKGGYKKPQITITAKANNIKISAVVRSLQITPDYLILKPGQSQKFICTAIDQYGEVIDIDHSNIVWETTGGEITPDGILKVDDKAQEIFYVTAKYISSQDNHNINSLNLGISLKIISYISSLNIFRYSVAKVGKIIDDPEHTTDLLEIISEMLFGNSFNFDIQTWLIQQLIHLISLTLDIVSAILINQSITTTSVKIQIIQDIENKNFSDITYIGSDYLTYLSSDYEFENQLNSVYLYYYDLPIKNDFIEKEIVRHIRDMSKMII